MEYHRFRLHHPRLQKVEYPGHRGAIQSRKQRHAGNHAPRNDEVTPLYLGGESGRQDTDGKRKNPDAEDHYQAADHFAHGGQRHNVTVSHGRQGGQRPPH